MSVVSMEQASHREGDDAYRGEVLRIGQFRIAGCRDGAQWLFQRQRGGNAPGGAAWDTLGYCVTIAGLERLHRAHIGDDTAALTALPKLKRGVPNG